MYTKQAAAQDVLAALRKHIGKQFSLNVEMIDTPPKPEMGDFAFPCFEYARGMERNPAEVANELAAKIGPTEFIEKVQAFGPYVNFFLKTEVLAERVLKEVTVAQERYGYSQSGEGKQVLVEYAQPNTHKEFHVGHIRNAVLGQSILNVLGMNGYETVGASYIGDIGAHVAKALWGYKKFQGDEPVEKADRAERLGALYTQATKYVDEHPEAKEEIDAVQRELEAREDSWTKLWKETRQWSIDEFKKIFEELSIRPDVWYYESQVEEDGKELAKKLLTEGIAKKSEGATIIDLEEEGLGAFLILKSDGSSLYATKDLALAYKKQKDHDPDRQIFVVDARQSHYFKQLIAALKRMGFKEQLVHISYEMVTLPEGAMSSRSGNVITYRSLRNEMINYVAKETRERHPDWSEKQIQETAEVLSKAAIIFMMLRQDPNTILTFSVKEALSFDGFTGPYLLYSIARMESMKRKSPFKAKYMPHLLTEDKEKELIQRLADYPILLQQVSRNFQVSAIAQWAFDTAKLFSEYYHDVRIIDEENKELTQTRLFLMEAVQQTLKNALSVYGIDTLKQM